MVQTGDPTNTGKGGESIWGGKFQVRPCFAEALLCDRNSATRMRSRMTWSTRPEEFSQWPTLDPIPTAASGSSHMPPSPPLISSEQLDPHNWNSWSYLLLFKVHSVWEGDRRLGHFGRTWTDPCESKEPPTSEGGGGYHQCSHHPCKSHGWLICHRHSFCPQISLFNFVRFRQDGFPVQGQGLREADDKAEQGLWELGGLHGGRGEWWQWFWGLWEAKSGKYFMPTDDLIIMVLMISSWWRLLLLLY